MFGLGRAYWIMLATLSGLVGLLALDRLLPPPLPDAGSVSAVVRDRNGAVLRAFPVEEGRWRLAADIDTLDPDFLAALLAYEDERFFEHWGVDLPALIRASRDSLAAGRIVSGGSTITMQLARLIDRAARPDLRGQADPDGAGTPVGTAPDQARNPGTLSYPGTLWR
jgi:penicillin-binding protein 1C